MNPPATASRAMILPPPDRLHHARCANRGLLASLTLAVAAGWTLLPAALAGPPQPDSPRPVDTLDQAGLQETFRLLRTHYIQRDSLSLEELNRAALEGLLARLDFGADLVPLSPQPASPDPPPGRDAPPLVAEPLDDSVVYLRPARFTLDVLPALDAALNSLPRDPHTTMILDLRTPGPPADFAVAARLLDRFVPEGQPLFSVMKPDDPSPRHFRSAAAPRWTGKLLLLVDAECTNAAETVAAILQRLLHAPLIGAATRGRTMQYDTAPISATHGLRFASAEMRLPDGTSIFRLGLQPAFALPANPAAKNEIFSRQPTEGVRPFVTNPERPRHNEAALVAGTAPELPHRLARAAGRPTPHDTPPLQDIPLQAAVDLLTARQALR